MSVDKEFRYKIEIKTYVEGLNIYGYTDGWLVCKKSSYEVTKEQAENIKKELDELE